MSVEIQQLIQVRQREQALVGQIREELQAEEPGARVAYLPNLLPIASAEFVIVAMEPSLAWDRNGNDQTAEQRVRAGYRNFMHSWEDFILHYSLQHYLGTYYITDVSKAAMTVKNAGVWRSRLYPRWVSLLREEIEVVATPTARIVPLGSDVETYLSSVTLPRPLSSRILHFSGQAASSRKLYTELFPEEYAQFRARVRKEDLLAFAETQLQTFFEQEQNHLGHAVPQQMIRQTLKRLSQGDGLTESRIRLLFTYYKQFGQLRAGQFVPTAR